MLPIGTVHESVRKRSVIAQLHRTRHEVARKASVYAGCAAMRLAPGEVPVFSTQSIVEGMAEDGAKSITKGAAEGTAICTKSRVTAMMNDLASSGAEPVGVMATVLLPEKCEEQNLRKMIRRLEEQLDVFRVQIMDVRTEVVRAAEKPVITLCGVGKARQNLLISPGGARPGDDIVLTKWAGLEGTMILAQEREQELGTRYPSDLIRTAREFGQYLSNAREAAVGIRMHASAMHNAREGGIFGALWELAESAGVGLHADLHKIPIRQETVEISEFFGINPYELRAEGCMILTTADGKALLAELSKENIPAVIAGKITEGRDRVLEIGGELRYLVPPKSDELNRVIPL